MVRRKCTDRQENEHQFTASFQLYTRCPRQINTEGMKGHLDINNNNKKKQNNSKKEVTY